MLCCVKGNKSFLKGKEGVANMETKDDLEIRNLLNTVNKDFQNDSLWNALFRIAKVADSALAVSNAMDSTGFLSGTPFFDIYGELVDAIYLLIGESAEILEDSIVYRVLHASDLTLKEKTDVLYAKYLWNR